MNRPPGSTTRILVQGLLMVGMLFAAGKTDIASREMEIIRKRLVEPILKVPLDERKVQEAIAFAERLGPDGTWSDIDYRNPDRVQWKGAVHMDRLLAMAKAWKLEGPGRGEAKLLEAFRRGLVGWDPGVVVPNWWWTTIGVPLILEQALLLTWSHLSDDEREHGDRILERARVHDPARDRSYIDMVGQNLVWVRGIQIHRGVLTENEAMIQEAVQSIAGTISVGEKEGIQEDFSFHQHGPQLYSLGYGLGFVLDLTEWARRVAGTHLAFPPEKIALLTDLVLEGHAWFGRGSGVDFGAIGRNVARMNLDRSGLAKAADLLSGIGGSRDPELEALGKHIRGLVPSPISGNRHFYRSDMMVHQASGFYASVKMTSHRTVGVECGNFENLMGDLTADGAMMLMRDGWEYSNIQPVWNWRRIPGITTVDLPEPISTNTDKSGYKNNPGTQSKQAFVGGVSDRRHGMAVFDFKREAPVQVSAKKAWFFHQTGFLAMGAALETPEENRLITTLNQCLRRGPVVWVKGTERRVLADGSTPLQGPGFVFHDGFAYEVPAGMTGQCDVGPVDGNWNRVMGGVGHRPVRAEVFCLYLEHGQGPTGGTFACQVMAAPSVEESAVRMGRDRMVPLANGNAVQAARGKDLLGVAFHGAGRLDLGDGEHIEVDEPCLILLSGSGIERILSVSNPKNEELSVRVTLGSQGKTRKEAFALPGGRKAGSTVSRRV